MYALGFDEKDSSFDRKQKTKQNTKQIFGSMILIVWRMFVQLMFDFGIWSGEIMVNLTIESMCTSSRFGYSGTYTLYTDIHSISK